MSIVANTMPDDPKRWAAWLEEHLVGLRLGNVIAEIELLSPGERLPLDDILSTEDRLTVATNGLGQLSQKQLGSLMRSREALLELQEFVILEGGTYWDRVPRTEAHQRLAKESTKQVLATIQPTSLQTTGPIAEASGRLVTRRSTAISTTTKIVTALAGIAATIALGLFLFPIGNDVPPGGGRTPQVAKSIIGAPDELTAPSPTPEEFRLAFAKASRNWFEIDVNDSAELLAVADRLSADFTTFQGTNPLVGKQQKWFVKKCQDWKSKVDSVREALRDGDERLFRERRVELDTIVEKMINALRKGPSQADLDAIG